MGPQRDPESSNNPSKNLSKSECKKLYKEDIQKGGRGAGATPLYACATTSPSKDKQLAKRTPKECKACHKDAKGSQKEPKGTKREPQIDQKGAKSRRKSIPKSIQKLIQKTIIKKHRI